jgi:hypothetical protein
MTTPKVESNKFVRILGACFAASTPHYNVETFANAKFIPAERGGVFYSEVHPEHAWRLRGRPAVAGAIPPSHSHPTP